MSLWEMSICGGTFIVAIVVVRELFRKRVPGRVFQILWLAAVLRLLLPVSIPWQYSVYSLAQRCALQFSDSGNPNSAVANQAPPEAVFVREGWQTVARAAKEQTLQTWVFFYLLGVVICTLYHVMSYLRWRRELQASLPVENPQIQAWADSLPLRRKVSVRQWEGTATPLTYGVIHPVILLPKSLAKEAPRQLKFVLVHEYMHIRHFDAVKKIILMFTCCVHWFNPLVWGMGVLANRDLELDCDERVVRYLGRDIRADYAYALIDLEEQRGDFLSWVNSFSKNAMEERVVAIMKGNKKSIIAGIFSGVMTVGVIMAFVTSASAMDKAEEASEAFADSGKSYHVNVKGEDGCIVTEQNAGVNETVEEQDSVSVNGDEGDGIAYAVECVEEQGSISAGAEINAELAYASEQGDVSEGVNGQLDLKLPKEYLFAGITADLHTGDWEYQGKKIAVFYDKDGWLLTNDVSSKDAVYLEVCRDKEGKIEQIKKRSKKEMQQLLKETGLVF